MQRLGAKALVWSAMALIAAGTVAGTGCTGKQPTELIPGVSSQMVVPKDLAGVTIEVDADGRTQFCQGYLVNPVTNIVDLPSTLGVIPAQSPDTVVTITVRGYDAVGVKGNDFAMCSGGTDVDGNANSAPGDFPRILRRSIQTYVSQHELFLPMPLSYSCIDQNCPMANQTCKGNQCVDASTDPASLPDFDPTLIDGTGLCFSPSECFPKQATFPAALVDQANCIYSLPSYVPASTLAGAINVKVYYQDWQWQPNMLAKNTYEQVVTNAGEEEILNADPSDCGLPTGSDGVIHPACEGFKVLGAGADAGFESATLEASVLPSDAGLDASLAYNPSAPRIQLAPGLCNLVHAGQTPPSAPTTGTLGYHTISDISVSGVCPPKLPLLPICADERNNNPVLPDASTTGDGVCNVSIPLTPAPSVLYLVMDDTAVMHGALGPGGSATELAISFADPVFKRTYAGFQFVTSNANGADDMQCSANTTAYLQPTVPSCSSTQSTNCPFDLINSIQTQVGMQLASWVPPANELAGDAGTTVCYADVDCVNAGVGSYCYKPNPAVPEGGAADAGTIGEDAGEDGGDGGSFTPGVCSNPQSLDLGAAMRLDKGTYAQVLGVTATLPPPAVAGVMFFVNRVPEVGPLGALVGSAGVDGGSGGTTGEGGVPEGGAAIDAGEDGGEDAAPVEAGSTIAPYPSPVAALDCPVGSIPGFTQSTGTPGDSTTVPQQVVQAQQVIESEAFNAYNNAGQSLQTFFVVLDNDRHDPSALQFFQQVQADLVQTNGAQPVVTLNTTDVSRSAIAAGNTNAKTEAQSFTNVISTLGTCLYEIPQTEMLSPTTSPQSVLVQYNATPLPPGAPPPPPGATQLVTIPYASGCNQAASLISPDAGAPDGWNFDTNRIRVCGASCTNLRTLVQNLTVAGIATGTFLDVPVTITPLCSTTGGGG